MSELINNSQDRKTKLKALILKLHNGFSQEEVKQELLDTLKHIPYGLWCPKKQQEHLALM